MADDIGFPPPCTKDRGLRRRTARPENAAPWPPVGGVALILAAMIWMTTLSGGTSLWTVGAMFFLLGAGLGLIMQNVVLAAQNAVPATQIGTATSTNNYFREVGATLGVAVFGTLFTTRLADSLSSALVGNAEQAVRAGITSPETLVPASVQAAGEPLRSAIIDAYAGALAPVFWYLVPILVVALVLAFALREVPLAEIAGMVARGEAVEREGDLPVAPPVVLVADQPAAPTADPARDDDQASVRA